MFRGWALLCATMAAMCERMRACGARSGEEETWRVIFINMASPAKIQGVLLHPAVTGCSEASSSWQHSPARLLKVVHPVLNRAARRTSDALGDCERKTEKRGEKRGGRGATSKWPIESTSVTPHLGCSHFVTSLQLPAPDPPTPHAPVMQTHQLTFAHTFYIKERKKQTTKKPSTSGPRACKFFRQLIKYLSGQWESEGYSGCRRNKQPGSPLCFPFLWCCIAVRLPGVFTLLSSPRHGSTLLAPPRSPSPLPPLRTSPLANVPVDGPLSAKHHLVDCELCH